MRSALIYELKNMKSKLRKPIRLKGYNYKQNGYYFVTIVTKNRKDSLLGKESLIETELADLVNKTQGLSVDFKVIMTNHIHLIFILQGCNLTLGEIVRRLKAKASHSIGDNIWQANYYEHIIRSDEALDRIREYIINNPVAEIIKFDQFYPEPINRHATTTNH